MQNIIIILTSDVLALTQSMEYTATNMVLAAGLGGLKR